MLLALEPENMAEHIQYVPLMKTDECLSSTAHIIFHLDNSGLLLIWITEV